MVKTLIFALLATMCATFLWGCGGKVSYTTVDGTMLGTTLHVVADVQGTSPQELYAAVMALDREAKASMSIFDPASLLSRLNRHAEARAEFLRAAGLTHNAREQALLQARAEACGHPPPEAR